MPRSLLSALPAFFSISLQQPCHGLLSVLLLCLWGCTPEEGPRLSLRCVTLAHPTQSLGGLGPVTCFAVNRWADSGVGRCEGRTITDFSEHPFLNSVSVPRNSSRSLLRWHVSATTNPGYSVVKADEVETLLSWAPAFLLINSHRTPPSRCSPGFTNEHLQAMAELGGFRQGSDTILYILPEGRKPLDCVVTDGMCARDAPQVYTWGVKPSHAFSSFPLSFLWPETW